MKPKEKIERYRLLIEISEKSEVPLIILGFLWLALLVIELIWTLTPFMKVLATGIWIIFIIDFLIRFLLAPAKLLYLKKNILTTISLIVPAFRVLRITQSLRILRTFRVARGFRLVKVIGSLNRGMKALGSAMERRAFGYVLTLTIIVCFVGAAAMHAFEKEFGHLNTYGEAIWWTAMLLTSIGSDYWPRSPEGRTLCFILSLYGFTVLGYFTAMLASYFIGRDAEAPTGEVAGSKQVKELTTKIEQLNKEIRRIKDLKNGNEKS